MESIKEFRKSLIKDITKRILDTKLARIEVSEIAMGDSPVLINNVNDDKSIFTLDRIDVSRKADGGEIVWFDGSSAYRNTSLTIDEIGTDELAGILEWLELYEEEIDELAENTDPTAGEGKKAKHVIRFYRRAWTDIVVEVDEDADENEIYEAASEKYNNGDYEDSAEDFENTDYEDVTDYYRDNMIPPLAKWD